MSTTIPIQDSSDASKNGKPAQQSSDLAGGMRADWLAGRMWHDSAPSSLKQDWGKLSPDESWARWRNYLAERKSPPPAAEDILGKADPLDWGLPQLPTATDGSDWPEAVAWRTSLDEHLVRSTGKQAASSGVQVEALLAELIHELQNPAAGVFSAAEAWRAVAAAYRLSAFATLVSSETWWRVAAVLQAIASEAESAAGDDIVPQQVLVSALLAGELPLVLSVQLPELKPFRRLRSAGKKALGEGLLAATDGEGLVDARLLSAAPTLVSCWTRCRAIGESLKKGCWASNAETQFEWVVRQTLRLTRVDGCPMLTDGGYLSWPAGPIDTALELAGDDDDDAAANHHLGKVLPSNDGDYDQDDLPEPSAESEWSSIALLANGWGKKANRTLVDYSADELKIEIEAQGRTLFSGPWTTVTSLNGKQLSPVDDWEQQCWFSDDDCDFLDLALELSDGAKLERQLFLAKDDGFLLVHDILHASDKSIMQGKTNEWRHSCRLPFASGFRFAPEKETRDGVFLDGKGAPRGTVLPLALAEWRVEPRFGELNATDSHLELVQSAVGDRLSCPLWFDLRPRRSGKPRTWRKLTVAESLEVAPNDKAVAYRVQVGDAQWCLYRSLTPPVNRTFIGQNTSSEMLIGRFLRSGELDELLEVGPA